MKRLDGVSLKHANDAYVKAFNSLVHVGRHQQVLGAIERGDAVLRDPRGAFGRRPARLWDGPVGCGCFHSEEQDDDETSKEDEKELPSQFVHPATEETDSRPEAE